MSALITVQKLTKHYGSQRGISNVSFEIEEGEVFGFLGPNGAGKTTTIRTLMALLKADSGSAQIAGKDIWTDSLAIKKFTGYLPGELNLDPGLTGGQILAYFGNVRGGVDPTYLKSLIDRFELDTSLKFRKYSSGNKRKVGLIQAFMSKPRLLILDEPTNGLDPLNQQEFMNLVAETRDEGRTVFLSSHFLSEVEQTSSRVGIIREGQLVRVGSVAELKDIKRHEVTITFDGAAPTDTFRALPEVISVEALPDGHTLRISATGSVDPIIKATAQYPVTSFTTQEPSLEEVFLRYYASDGAKQATKESAHV